MERRQALHPIQEAAATGTLEAALTQATAHVEAGRYFEAHDVLEPAWLAAKGNLKTILQGLIQICAGLHKRSRGQTKGSDYLISRGLTKVKLCSHALPAEVVKPFIDKTLE